MNTSSGSVSLFCFDQETVSVEQVSYLLLD